MSNLPKGWEEVKLGDFCDILDNQRIPISSEKRAEIKGNIPYYGANGVQDYINDFIFNETLVLLAEDGGNFNDYQTRPIAYMIHGKSWVNNHTHVLRAKNGENYFLFYSLVHKDITSFINGGTRTKLNRGELVKIPIFVPPLEEQKKIADILSTVDKKIAFVEENINATEELKKGLMQKLLTEGIGHTEFKDSELGKVPSSWKVVKLVEAISIMTDYVANGSFASLAENVNVYDEPNYAIYVRLFDLRKGLGHSDQKYVDEQSYKFLSKSNLEGREILIANIGANVGETFLMPDINKPATLAPNMIEVKVDQEKLISEFLYFYLTGYIGLKELEKVTEGSGQPKINKTKLKTINLPLPNLDEQSKIVEILSTVDKKIENLKEKKLFFEELKKGLMQKLLNGEVRV
ncbi:restriction endonuclease subunit S [Aliarcobacter butzleri]|uniref:restriction endonuclease subunit S n=1 Tax=Aliarcobacter butzleri TaxID=28197 RepID=UPI0021B689DC|nr:restriction endonuclease subunit S [Aliarcobacter butzleri]MCT7565298.1 restriction endonuclease subunit S [Aliarcobacter butzleri]